MFSARGQYKNIRGRKDINNFSLLSKNVISAKSTFKNLPCDKCSVAVYSNTRDCVGTRDNDLQ